MDSISYRPLDWREPKEARVGPRLLLLVSLLATAGVLAGAYVLPSGAVHEETPPLVEAGVSQLVYPAQLISEVEQPLDGQWLMPAAAVPVGDATFVLDTGNNRIEKLDQAGRVLATFGASGEGTALQQPMAMASDGSRLFVANSLAAEVLVLDLSGMVEQVLPLRPLPGDAKTPRPIGVAATADGGLVVSDADNHRVLRLDGEGRVLWSAGVGARAGGSEGFNVPGAVTVDAAGNIYVVDSLNGRVVELSVEGAFVRKFGRLGDTAGTLARPKGVAVDGAGRVFVSDGLQAAVEVFAADGTYLGVIGRRDPMDPDSGSLFRAPAGLWLAGENLYVADRFAGLVTLALPGAPPATATGD